MSSGEIATSLIPVPVAALTRPEIVRGPVAAMPVAGLALRDGLGVDGAEGMDPVGARSAVGESEGLCKSIVRVGAGTVGERLAAGAVSAAGAAQAVASASVAQNLANAWLCRGPREQVANSTVHSGRARCGDPQDGPPPSLHCPPHRQQALGMC